MKLIIALLALIGLGPSIYATSVLTVESGGIVNSSNMYGDSATPSSPPSSTQQGWMLSNNTLSVSPHLFSAGSSTMTYNMVQFINGNGVVGGIQTSGSSTLFNTSSDARLKENIRDFTDSGPIIDRLRPRLFDWKPTEGNRQGSKDSVGFVAQEENAVDPVLARIGAVTVGDDDPATITKQWQRSDQALVPILVAELKSERARLAAAEARIAKLEALVHQ